MRLRIDPSSAEPLFDQIAASLRHEIATGVLRPGDQLPPARELANDLQVNLHTVLRAYALLRDEGLLEVRRGRGTAVTARAQGAADPRLTAAVVRVTTEAHRAGLSEQELTDLVVQAFRSHGSFERIRDQ